MYPKVLITNHQMEDNLKTHLEEVNLKEIRLESHLLIHLLYPLDGQHLTCACLYHHGMNHMYWNQQPSYHTKSYNTQPVSKYIVSDAHIKVFKKVIKVNGETMEVDIINMFGFTLKDNIFERG
jgi:pantothenate kinase